MCVPVHASQSSELQSSHTVPGVRINYTSVRRPVLSFPRAIYRPEGFGQTFGRDEAQKSSFLFPIAILNAVVNWKHLIGLQFVCLEQVSFLLTDNVMAVRDRERLLSSRTRDAKTDRR